MLKPKKWTGKPISMPGVYAGVPIEVYHSATACIEPSISSSGLRRIFTKSPKHYFAESPYNPKRVESEESAALILGRAAHHLLFGMDDFKKEFAIRPETLGGEKWNGNRTVCNLWLEDRSKEGRTVLTPDQFSAVAGMAEELFQEPLVKAGILNGLIEHSWAWKDKETGVWLRARPDASPNDSLDFCDLKTTRSVQYHDLCRTVYDYGYFQQGALLNEGCRVILGQPLHSFTLVFVESKAPYCTAIVTLKEGDLSRGARANAYAVRKFADGMKTGKWLGPAGETQDARYIELPEWSQKQLDERLKAEGV